MEIKRKRSYWAEPGLLYPNSDIACDVIKKVSDYYDINTEQIHGRSRIRHIAEARHMCAYFLYKKLRPNPQYEIGTWGVKKIGQLIKRDHATILYSIKQVNNLSETDGEFAVRFNCLKNKLGL